MGASESNSSAIKLPQDFPKNIVFFRLANLANTCYCNSVLQSLLFSTNISDYFKYLISKTFPKEFANTPLYHFCQMYMYKFQLINQALSKPDETVSNEISIRPSKFLESVYRETSQFIRNEQNDSHEFLLFLISSFDNTISKLKKQYMEQNDEQSETNSRVYENIPLFSKLFEGSRSSSFECAFCHHVQEKVEMFTYLDIGIPLDNENHELDLQKLIDYSLDPDNISSDGGWECSGCKQKGANVEITSYIKYLPSTLVIQLQRFKYSKKTQTMEKISKFVKIQNQIHVNSGNGPCEYELKSAICHIGGSLHEGHFIALLRVPRLNIDQVQNLNGDSQTLDDYWIYTSDSRIYLIDQRRVDSLFRGGGNDQLHSPYVLLYEIKKNEIESVPVGSDN